ncbi:hypothetical protein F5884DRAFT_760091 [Xylogone sp. PMI_703]|nr:hypothetical protein F5884DRAFT_760091 [Xylogone sp. PMI_703]
MASPNYISISASPCKDPAAVRRVVTSHLQEIFGDSNLERRTSVMQKIYHEDLVWYHPEDYGGNVIIGRDAVNKMIQKEMDQYPGFALVGDGQIIVTQNLAVAHWDLGTPEAPDLIKGVHYLIVEDGKIKAFWTAHLKMPGGH